MSEQIFQEAPGYQRLIFAATMSGLLLASCTTASDPQDSSQPTTTFGLLGNQMEVPLMTIGGTDIAPAPRLVLNAEMLGVSEVRDDLYVYEETPVNDERFLPFAEVSLNNGQMIFADVSPDGIDQTVFDWLMQRVAHREPLIREALSGENLDKVVFALGEDYGSASVYDSQRGHIFGYYNEKNKQVVLEISPYVRDLDAEFVEQYMTHEVSHALIDRTEITRNPELNGKNVNQEFMSACAFIRESALKEIQANLAHLAQDINRLSELVQDPVLKERYSLLADYFQSGELVGLVRPVKTQIHNGNTEIDMYPTCNTTSISELARWAGEQQGLGEPMILTEDEEFYDLLSKIDTSLSETMRQRSLYRILTEGNYQSEGVSMGHPEDNVDELAASTLNLVITYPEEFARMLLSVPDDQRQAVLDIVRITVDQIVEAYPNLSNYMSDHEATFMQALNQ